MTEGFDPQSLLAQALEMQQRLVQAQEEAANAIHRGFCGRRQGEGGHDRDR